MIDSRPSAKIVTVAGVVLVLLLSCVICVALKLCRGRRKRDSSRVHDEVVAVANRLRKPSGLALGRVAHDRGPQSSGDGKGAGDEEEAPMSCPLTWSRKRTPQNVQRQDQQISSILADPIMAAKQLDSKLIKRRRVLAKGASTCLYDGHYTPPSSAKPEVVAIKRALVEHQSDLLEELRALRRQVKLSHSHVVSLFGFFVDEVVLADGAGNLAYELCTVSELGDLGDLHDAVVHQPQDIPDPVFPMELRAWFLLQAAEALNYVHSRNIVHCEVESRKYVLFSDLTLKLLQFSRHALADGPTAGRPRGTNSDGSNAFVAPEAAKGTRYDKRADVFSFGVVALQVLMRRTPTNLERESWARGDSLPEIPESILRAVSMDCAEDAPTKVQRMLQSSGESGQYHGADDDDDDHDANADDDDEEKLFASVERAERLQTDLWNRMLTIGRKCSAQVPRDRLPLAAVIGQLRGSLATVLPIRTRPAAESFRIEREAVLASRWRQTPQEEDHMKSSPLWSTVPATSSAGRARPAHSDTEALREAKPVITDLV